MIRVLIVDDSDTARELLSHILSADPDIQIVGTVRNGMEAIKLVDILKLDVITMDVHMPGMDGYQTTRHIMETKPIPIIIVSSAFNDFEARTSIKAMEAGALTVLPRPPGPGSPDYDFAARQLVATVKTMAGVRVIRRWRSRTVPALGSAVECKPPAVRKPVDIQVIVIGASTGGPAALDAFLKKLPREIRIPIVVVQHITRGFCDAFIDWIHQSTGWQARKAANGCIMEPGCVYVAPDDAHLEISSGLCTVLNHAAPDDGLRPSVKRLFLSAAAHYGDKVAAVLLSGMGRDGAQELRQLRDLGAITFAQDEESCVVFGMPGEAVKLDAAVHVLPPELIAEQLGRYYFSPKNLHHKNF